VSRETASAGPSPAQLAELRLLYTNTRSRGFPRRRTGSPEPQVAGRFPGTFGGQAGSRNRRFLAVSAEVHLKVDTTYEAARQA